MSGNYLLCLDIGNSHIYAGVFLGDEIQLRFRYASNQPCTSDVLGLFLRNVLRENNITPEEIAAISLCSVVPALDYSVISACKKYFNLEPLTLKPGIKTGLKIDVKNPLELGADRIANAVAAIEQFPDQNRIVVDFGTATTICAISKDRIYLGGAILPGFKLSMQALSQNTAKLSDVDIIAPEQALGKTTAANIQSGIYYSQLGAIREITNRLNATVFKSAPGHIISTGGYAQLFEKESVNVTYIPDLVLHGLRIIWNKN